VVGFRDVQIAVEVAADGPRIMWRPRGGAKAPADSLTTQLWAALENKWNEPIVGRFVIDGWAVTGADGQP
jgi:hypothetical protein